MTFADLPAGAAVFVDANTFVFHCTLDPVLGPSCTELLDRIGHGQITGFTSTHVLTEVAHRLMMLEAARHLGKPHGSMVQFLKQHPVELQRLTGFRQAIEDLCASNLRILAIAAALVPTGATVSQRFGLLSNDALIIAVMQANGLANIASHDTDFDRVPGITRFGPV